MKLPGKNTPANLATSVIPGYTLAADNGAPAADIETIAMFAGNTTREYCATETTTLSTGVGLGVATAIEFTPSDDLRHDGDSLA